jgi:uncharacterized protein (DUF39 family)
VAGKSVTLLVEAYGTDCYPSKRVEKEIYLKDMMNAILCNPRNAYQNYNCAVNLSKHIIYTYMGPLRPRAGNANYCTSGALSPLMNDPYFKTIGIGTRIFLGGGVGYVCFPGTQHHPGRPRTSNGLPTRPAGTLMVVGDLKQMDPRYLVGVSMLGYGCSLAVGLGVPIPLLNEEMAHFCAVSNEDIITPVVDYGIDYPKGSAKVLQEVSYAQLMSGKIMLDNQEVPTVPLSSMVRAREVANHLKEWITSGRFLLGEPVDLLPSVEPGPENETVSRES